MRVQKVDSGGTANYVTDGSSPASAVIKDGSAVYTPGLSERRGTASKFYHADALGSTRGLTDSSQAVTDSLRYDAFGNVTNRTGTTPTPFGYVGKEQYQTDGDSGLLLLGHRYYDPSIGRFLSSDPAQAGTNWYVYCDNNPLTETDPEGLLTKKEQKAVDDLAVQQMRTWMPKANKKHQEITGKIYYFPPKPGQPKVFKSVHGNFQYDDAAIDDAQIPSGAVLTANWHTHEQGPDGQNSSNSDEFSADDESSTNNQGVPTYIGETGGGVYRLDPVPKGKKRPPIQHPYPGPPSYKGSQVGHWRTW